VLAQRSVNYSALSLLLQQTTERKMRDILKTVLRAISTAWAKRRHEASRDKIEDKMVADLEAILANAKRAREQIERDRNEIRRTA